MTTFLKKLRNEKYGKEKLNFGTLHKWLEECSSVPTEDTQPFIVDFNINIDDSNDDNNEFRFFVSTKLLLKNAVDADVWHTDGTYKLIWQNFPVLLVGMTDANRKFHLFGVCVSTHERTADFEFMFRAVKAAVLNIYSVEVKPRRLVADAAFAIQNGFELVFELLNAVIMCWAHLRRAVSKKICEFIRDKKSQNQFLADLDKLQLAKSPTVFEKASELFIQKWKLISNDFMEYFVSEWIVKHPNWYEGFAKRTPSHNNALESTNRVVKDEHTFRERYDISQFRFVLFNMLVQWSVEHKEGLRIVNNGNPTIELKWWTAAYNFARSNVKITISRHENFTTYIIPLSADVNDKPLNSWRNFDDYKDALNTVRTTFETPITAANWTTGECDCGAFFKEYICEHVIGIALRLKCITAPVEAKTIPIGQKRKRGRPAKARPALERQ